MRPVDSHTTDLFAVPATGLCHCWRFVRRDGVEVGVTDHDTDISFTGTQFRAMPGAEGTALESSAGLAVDNADIIGALDIDVIGEADLEAGRYDGARVQLWRVCWEDPEARLLLRSGTLGEVVRQGQEYHAEFRSLKHHLDQVTGRLYGRACDADFGDRRCGVDLSSWRWTGTVVTGGVRQLGVMGDHEIDPRAFEGGLLTAQSGSLAGTSFAIRAHGRQEGVEQLDLWEALQQPLETGVSVTLTAGCDKRFATCRDRFDNQLNFRGFPHIPGSDSLLVVARPGGGL